MFVVLRSVRIAPVRHKIREVLTYPGRNRREFAISLSLTAVYWVMQGVVLAIMLNALGVDPDPLLVLGMTSVPILVGMLSPLPGRRRHPRGVDGRHCPNSRRGRLADDLCRRRLPAGIVCIDSGSVSVVSRMVIVHEVESPIDGGSMSTAVHQSAQDTSNYIKHTSGNPVQRKLDRAVPRHAAGQDRGRQSGDIP